MNQCVQWRQGKAKRKSQELTEAIQIDDIEIFERVVATSSMSAAARELQLSPQCVCNRISRFEKRLGMKLFHRTTRELRPTPQGQGFYQRAVQILRAVQEAKAFVAFTHDGTAAIEPDPEGWYPPSVQPVGEWVLGEFKTGTGHLLLAPAFCTPWGRWMRAASAEGCPTHLAQIPQRWRNFSARTV